MSINDIFEETYIALSGNKARSGLTVLGIIIGISSVIAMVSIGQGAQGVIQANIQSIGSNLILVMPGAQRGVGVQVSQGRGSARSLTQEDSDAISQEVSLIKAVAPELSSRYQITSKGKNTNTQVVGTVSLYPEVRNVEIDTGSFITDQNVRSLSKVAVIGPTARDDLFGEGADAVGQTIRINKIEFKIIGVTKAKGGSGFGSQDDMIFIPLSSAQKFLAGDAYLSTISVEAQDADSMAAVQQQITDLLLTRHHIGDPQLADFSILNQADIVSAASSVTQTFTILLAAVAGISLGGWRHRNYEYDAYDRYRKDTGNRLPEGSRRKKERH